MRRLIRGAVYIAVLMVANASSASPLEDFLVNAGTIGAGFTPSFASGQLTGCGIEFTAISRDWQYKQGKLIRVGGSVGLMKVKSTMAVVLKVVLHDISPDTLTLTPAPPAVANFVTKDFQSSASYFVSSTVSDTPGALFSVFKMGALNLFTDMAEMDLLRLSIARRQGGSDIPVSIDLTVKDTKPDGTKIRSDATMREFVDCARKFE